MFSAREERRSHWRMSPSRTMPARAWGGEFDHRRHRLHIAPQLAGFDLFNGTQVVFRGNIVASDNQTVGIFLGGASSFRGPRRQNRSE